MSSLVYEISPNRSCGVFVDVHPTSLDIMGKSGIFIQVSENRFLSNISKTKPFRVSSA